MTAVTTPTLVRLDGGTFTMGSDRHYPEEAPAHRVEVEDFAIGRTPVTNDEFAAFVAATGHVTLAERAPDPADYPGRRPGDARTRVVGVRPARATGQARQRVPVVAMDRGSVLAASVRPNLHTGRSR